MQDSLMSPAMTSNNEVSPLTIWPGKVCFIIVKNKEFDGKDEVTEPDPGSNPADDMYLEVQVQVSRGRTKTILLSRSLHR
jgi:hypothetical protein